MTKILVDSELLEWALRVVDTVLPGYQEYRRLSDSLRAMLSVAPKAPTTDDRKDELAADSKRALELLGSIYYCGRFAAETRNEQELEALMRKHGYFIETEAQFDAYCRRVAQADTAMAAQKGEKG